ncbi:hypothetical protein F4802DRAFT_600992 [Xylaria palmicola]|nr:hypothetical protein F4802DRAFT_600992 [Xylaria palmicola]
MSLPSRGDDTLSPTTRGQLGSSSHGGRTSGATSMTDEEFKDFRRKYEARLLPAIIEKLGLAGAGGQVYLHRRERIIIITREIAPTDLKQQIEHVVAEHLCDELRGKISVEFEVGEVKRSGC